MRIAGIIIALALPMAPFSADAGPIEVITGDGLSVAGPYAPATVAGDVVYTSGQIALDPSTGQLVGDDIDAQVHQALENLEAVLSASGSSLAHTLKVTVFLKHAHDFQAMNEVYQQFFPDHRPARTTVPGADWGNGVLVEVDAIALRADQ